MPPPLKSKITSRQEEMLWEKNLFSLNCSTGLINAVTFYLIKSCGVHLGRDLKLLKTEHVKFDEDSFGKFVLIDVKSVVSYGRVIKHYDDPHNTRSFYKLLKLYMKCVANEGSLLVRPIASIKDYICYSPWPLGVAIMDQTIQGLMKAAGEGGRYGNVSVVLLAIDVLKNYGAGKHCLETFADCLCGSTAGYKNKMWGWKVSECSFINCRDKNPEAGLIMSHLLDPPYPDLAATESCDLKSSILQEASNNDVTDAFQESSDFVATVSDQHQPTNGSSTSNLNLSNGQNEKVLENISYKPKRSHDGSQKASTDSSLMPSLLAEREYFHGAVSDKNTLSVKEVIPLDGDSDLTSVKVELDVADDTEDVMGLNEKTICETERGKSDDCQPLAKRMCMSKDKRDKRPTELERNSENSETLYRQCLMKSISGKEQRDCGVDSGNTQFKYSNNTLSTKSQSQSEAMECKESVKMQHSDKNGQAKLNEFQSHHYDLSAGDSNNSQNSTFLVDDSLSPKPNRSSNETPPAKELTNGHLDLSPASSQSQVKLVAALDTWVSDLKKKVGEGEHTDMNNLLVQAMSQLKEISQCINSKEGALKTNSDHQSSTSYIAHGVLTYGEKSVYHDSVTCETDSNSSAVRNKKLKKKKSSSADDGNGCSSIIPSTITNTKKGISESHVAINVDVSCDDDEDRLSVDLSPPLLSPQAPIHSESHVNGEENCQNLPQLISCISDPGRGVNSCSKSCSVLESENKLPSAPDLITFLDSVQNQIQTFLSPQTSSISKTLPNVQCGGLDKKDKQLHKKNNLRSLLSKNSKASTAKHSSANNQIQEQTNSISLCNADQPHISSQGGWPLLRSALEKESVETTQTSATITPALSSHLRSLLSSVRPALSIKKSQPLPDILSTTNSNCSSLQAEPSSTSKPDVGQQKQISDSSKSTDLPCSHNSALPTSNSFPVFSTNSTADISYTKNSPNPDKFLTPDALSSCFEIKQTFHDVNPRLKKLQNTPSQTQEQQTGMYSFHSDHAAGTVFQSITVVNPAKKRSRVFTFPDLPLEQSRVKCKLSSSSLQQTTSGLSSCHLNHLANSASPSLLTESVTRVLPSVSSVSPLVAPNKLTSLFLNQSTLSSSSSSTTAEPSLNTLSSNSKVQQEATLSAPQEPSTSQVPLHSVASLSARHCRSEICLGDYLPQASLIPASSIRILTQQRGGGLELVLSFDHCDT